MTFQGCASTLACGSCELFLEQRTTTYYEYHLLVTWFRKRISMGKVLGIKSFKEHKNQPEWFSTDIFIVFFHTTYQDEKVLLSIVEKASRAPERSEIRSHFLADEDNGSVSSILQRAHRCQAVVLLCCSHPSLGSQTLIN